jgi:hypothetical protein
MGSQPRQQHDLPSSPLVTTPQTDWCHTSGSILPESEHYKTTTWNGLVFEDNSDITRRGAHWRRPLAQTWT